MDQMLQDQGSAVDKPWLGCADVLPFCHEFSVLLIQWEGLTFILNKVLQVCAARGQLPIVTGAALSLGLTLSAKPLLL